MFSNTSGPRKVVVSHSETRTVIRIMAEGPSQIASMTEGTLAEAKLMAKALFIPELVRVLQALVCFNDADPDLYKGDDDGVLGRIMFQAHTVLEDFAEKE